MFYFVFWSDPKWLCSEVIPESVFWSDPFTLWQPTNIPCLPACWIQDLMRVSQCHTKVLFFLIICAVGCSRLKRPFLKCLSVVYFLSWCHSRHSRKVVKQCAPGDIFGELVLWNTSSVIQWYSVFGQRHCNFAKNLSESQNVSSTAKALLYNAKRAASVYATDTCFLARTRDTSW